MPACLCQAGQAGQGDVRHPPSTYNAIVLGFGDGANGMAAAVPESLELSEQRQPPPAASIRHSNPTTLPGDALNGVGSKDLESDQQQQQQSPAAQPAMNGMGSKDLESDQQQQQQPPAAQPKLSSLSHLPAPLSTPQLLFWVMVAAAQPVCVAMIGVLVRYLEASCLCILAVWCIAWLSVM